MNDFFYKRIFDKPCIDREVIKRNIVIYMVDRLQGIFEYSGLPDSIPKSMLELQLQCNGFSVFAMHEDNLYCYYAGLGGEPDVYYRPTIATIANPAQKISMQLKIGAECVVVKNDLMFHGLMPLCNRYAEMLTDNIISMRVANINLRKVALISASDDTSRAAAEKYQKDIEDGKTSIPINNAFAGGIQVQPIAVSGVHGVLTELIEQQQYILGSFYNEVGIVAPFNMKRERLSESENSLSSSSSAPLIMNMLESREDGIRQVNEMFGTNISVKLASVWRGIDDISAYTETEEEQSKDISQEESEVAKDD